MELLKKKNCVLEYDATTPCMIARFNGFMTSEEFRTLLNDGLKQSLARIKPGQEFLWLADTRNHSVQGKADTDWVGTDWTPRALKGGLRFVAFVLPKNAFGEMSVQNYINQAKKVNLNEMNIGMFDSEVKAKEWFMNMTKLAMAG